MRLKQQHRLMSECFCAREDHQNLIEIISGLPVKDVWPIVPAALVFIHHRSDFSIGVIESANFHPLLMGSIEGSLKVLEGKDNWLFLDNDSNQSVEQYTWKLKISRS